MSEYIKKENVLDLIDKAFWQNWTARRLCDEVRSLPVADIRPVVYAECVKFSSARTGRFTLCSNCIGRIGPKDKFCKHCGCDLRGDRQ